MNTMGKTGIQSTDSEQCYSHSYCCKISWSAVFAGAIAALGLSFLINLLNVGLGFSAYALGGNTTALTVTTLTWLALTAFITMLISGLLSGYLAKKYYFNCWSGAIHGFIGWGISLVALVALGTQLSIALPLNLQAIASFEKAIIVKHSDNNTAAMPSELTSPITQDHQGKVVIDEEKAAKLLAAIGLQAFLLFLIGALASSLGGHIGIRCNEKSCNVK